MYDVDKDGLVSRQDMEHVMGLLGIAPHAANAMLDAVFFEGRLSLTEAQFADLITEEDLDYKFTCDLV